MGKKSEESGVKFPKGFLYGGRCTDFYGTPSMMAFKATAELRDVLNSSCGFASGWHLIERVEDTLRSGEPTVTLWHKRYADLYKAIKEGRLNIPECLKYLSGSDIHGANFVVPLLRDEKTGELITHDFDFVDTDGNYASVMGIHPFTVTSYICKMSKQSIHGSEFINKYGIKRVELADTLEVSLDSTVYSNALEDIIEGIWEDAEYDEEAGEYIEDLDEDVIVSQVAERLVALDSNYWECPCIFKGCSDLKEVVVGSEVIVRMSEDDELGRPAGRVKRIKTHTEEGVKELQKLFGCPKGCVIKVRGTDIEIVCDEPVEPDWVSEVSYKV